MYLTPGSLVVFRATDSPWLEVLPAFYLDEASLDPSLTEQGWRLAQYSNTKHRILVRPTGENRWLEAWGTRVAGLEAREVCTSVTHNADGFTLVATLGGLISGRQPYTLLDNIQPPE